MYVGVVDTNMTQPTSVGFCLIKNEPTRQMSLQNSVSSKKFATIDRQVKD